MPCHLTVYDPDSKAKKTWVCDEANTERLVSDDHAAKGPGEYTDVNGQVFRVDWTRERLIGFARRRHDGLLIASGDAQGRQSPTA